MLRWFVALTVLTLLLAGSALAQNQASFAYLPENGTALTQTCDAGSGPIPDGRIVRIFWDQDGDGVDATDPLATVCTQPPICETGPAGTMNYNQFEMNGVSVLETSGGYFFTLDMFTVVGSWPNPARFYMRIYEPDGVNYFWTSAVKTLADGPQEIYFTRAEWTCATGGPQCTVRDEHE